jgi:hypothetical protein
MLSTVIKTEATTSTTNQSTSTHNTHIFVLKLHDGRFIVGQAANVARRIASINSGLNPMLPKALLVKEIVGVKPITEERNYVSTVRRFCDQYGTDAVVAV